MKRTTCLAVTTAAAFLLSGCADWTAVEGSASPASTDLAPYTPGPGVQEAIEDEAAAPAPTTTAPPPTASTNSRGNVETAIGEQAGFTYNSNDAAVNFTVTAINVDVACTESYSSDPENGHFIAVDMTFTTDPTLQDYTYVSNYDFRIIGADGVTQTNLVTVGTYGCLSNSVLLTSDEMGPGQTYAGTILLDSPVTSGALVYAPGGLGNGGGWEWTF